MYGSKLRILTAAFAVAALFCLLFAFGRSFDVSAGTNSTVFSNTQSITINTASGLTAPTVASLYPSTVTVSGMTGTTTKVEVTLKGFTHTRPQDLDFLLVSPTGAKYVFLSDVDGTTMVSDRVFNIRDDAASVISAGSDSPSGSYKPTSGDAIADVFPAPAPSGPYSQPSSSSFASVFNGTDPNGVWSLYVVDDTLLNPGAINDGWVLTVTTNGPPVSFANSSNIVLNDVVTPSTPYGTPINVSGMTGVISNLKVNVNGLSHQFPADVDILLVSPSGKGLVLLSDAGGSTAAVNANLTFDDAAANNVTTVATGTYKPTDISSENFDTFTSPAPLRPYLQFSSPLSSFNGSSPDGDWRLYVLDDNQNNSGSISGGWSLDITTAPATPPIAPSCSAPSFATSNFAAGIGPTNAAVADLNGDGKQDLAVTNQVSNDVSIMLGNGNGTFAVLPTASAGSGPYAIAAGKFNADNNFDLAVANSTSNTVSILIGNGNGTFAAPVNYFVGASPISIAAGDINNDGKMDLVVANFGGFLTGTVSVLLGNGNGTFTAGNSVRTRTQPAYVQLVRLDGDNNLDLIVANFGSNSVSTFFGTGAGTFQLSQNLTVGSGPVAVDVADVTLDGIRDLIVANYNSDSVMKCPGTAVGTFGSCTANSTTVSPNPVSVASADFLGAGSTTFATALAGSNQVKMSDATTSITVGQSPNAVRTGDFNGDGKPDVVSVNFGSNDVSILLNSCKVAKGNLTDYNGDRKTDWAVFRPSTQSWYIYSLNQFGGSIMTFARPTDTIISGDFNGDRLADFGLYRPETGLWFVVDRNGPIIYQQWGAPTDIPVPADYDGDGMADVAVFRPSEGNWYIRRSSDNAMQVTQWGTNGDKPAQADFDGDGKDDVAVFRPSSGVWYILKSSDLSFNAAQFGTAEDKVVQGDYDGDGKADIAVFRPSSGAWYILRSSDGGFDGMVFGNSTDLPVLGDFDGDGRYDQAVWRPSDGTWYVWKSSDHSLLAWQWGANGDVPVPAANVR